MLEIMLELDRNMLDFLEDVGILRMPVKTVKVDSFSLDQVNRPLLRAVLEV